MKILLVNKFLYPAGGDAVSTLTTGQMLLKKGHEVFYWGMKHPRNPPYPFEEYFVDYVDYDRPHNFREKVLMTANIFYSIEAQKKLASLLKVIRPDVAHLNNFAHQISPSILDVFRKFRIPVVMTLRDHKMVCPFWYLLSGGKICEKCKNGRYYWCFLKKCTKGSRAKSFINTVEMYLHHKILHIYDRVDVFISPSNFLKNKLNELGFKKEILVLPNFVDPAEFEPSFEPAGKSILYVGRLSQEKGLFTLLEAVKNTAVTLKIIGAGPLKTPLLEKIAGGGLDNVILEGYKTGEDLKNEIRQAAFTVIPSICYENNPRTVIESFASGKPVVGARIGGIVELVKDFDTGLTFEPGNVADLKEKISFLIVEPELIKRMGKKARKLVEDELNPHRHYEKLLKIYRLAINRKK